MSVQKIKFEKHLKENHYEIERGGEMKSHLEQSVLGETEKDKLIPQLAGSAWANWLFGLNCLAADVIHSQADFISAGVEAADARDFAPAQQEAGGFPEPLNR